MLLSRFTGLKGMWGTALRAGLDSSFKSLVTRTLADFGVDPEKVLALEMNYDIRRAILMNYLHPEKS